MFTGIQVIQFLSGHLGKPLEQSPSAYGNWLKGTIEAVERGKLSVSFIVRDEMTNAGKTLHGGISSAMLDEVMGATCMTIADKGEFHVSVTLNVDFLSPAQAGDELLASAWVVKEGRQLVFCEATLTNKSNGRVVAKGHSQLMKTFPENK
jgi:acyl-coenzyme A thioesterase 13